MCPTRVRPDDFVHAMKSVRYNRHTGVVTRILAEFYPDREIAPRDITACSVGHDLTSKLAARRYLERVDERHIGRRYRLTSRGRFRVLCDRVGVRLLELCILAEAYVISMYQSRANLTPSYPVYDIMDTFDQMYSKKTIQNASSMVCAGGLAVKTSPYMIRLTEHAENVLAAHADTVMELHYWIAGIPNTLNRMAVEDPQRLHRIISS